MMLDMIWLVSFLVEISFFRASMNGHLKQIAAGFLVLLIVGVTMLEFSWFGSWFAIVVVILLPFRLLNVARVIKNRMHPSYLSRATLRTSVSIMVLHVAGFLFVSSPIWALRPYFPVISLVVAASMFGLALLHVYKTRHIRNTKHYSDNELPTVSVCIPARNETDDLEQCLRSIIANDYPKLEILVLDDCSQDKTALTIKSFAQDGVRFVQGEPPAARWLAKNQAYDKLTHEATGELLLFCGVDVRLGPHAIRALVTTMLNRNKTMISVLPLRFYSRFSEAFIQPMRYWWELVPPRRLLKRPAVLSTCWLVNRKKLAKCGGFTALSHAIMPEGFFARQFIKTDGYSFIRADEELDVQTVKPFSEQWATAVRTNYPQIRRRPEMAILLTIFSSIFLISPFGMLFYGIFTLNTPLTILTGLNCILLTCTHVLIMKISDPANVSIALFTLPFAALAEIIIGHTSMLKYEFGIVEWKDRNVCIPVMHAYPKLPNIPE